MEPVVVSTPYQYRIIQFIEPTNLLPSHNQSSYQLSLQLSSVHTSPPLQPLQRTSNLACELLAEIEIGRVVGRIQARQVLISSPWMEVRVDLLCLLQHVEVTSRARTGAKLGRFCMQILGTIYGKMITMVTLQ